MLRMCMWTHTHTITTPQKFPRQELSEQAEILDDNRHVNTMSLRYG